MSRKPFFTDEKVHSVVEYGKTNYLTDSGVSHHKMAQDLQVARAEAAKYKKALERMRDDHSDGNCPYSVTCCCFYVYDAMEALKDE